MKRLLWILLLGSAFGQLGTYTPNLHLYKPAAHESGYQVFFNPNFDLLDSILSGGTTATSFLTNSLSVPSLSSGLCVQTTTGGKLTTASTACNVSNFTFSGINTNNIVTYDPANFSGTSALVCRNANGDLTTTGCSTAGGSAVVTNPAGGVSQTIVQASGTMFNFNVAEQIVFADQYAPTSSGGINEAFAACTSGTCHVIAGLGTITACNVSVPANGHLSGHGRALTVLQCGTTSAPVISNVGTSARVDDLTVQHSSTPVAGGDGVVTTGDRVSLYNIESKNNYNGYNLGAVTNAEAWGLTGEYCQNDALHFNTGSGTTMQWIIHGGLYEQCAGWGVNMTTTTNFTGPTILDGYQVFGNHLGGMKFQASTGRISDIFIGQGVLSQNNGDNMFFDNAGRNVQIVGQYNEQSGQNTSGYGFNHGTTDTPSNVGDGIHITSNCDNTNPPIIVASEFWEPADAAMMSQCAGTQYRNNTVFDAGFVHVSGAAALRTGVSVQASDQSVDGLFCSQGGGAGALSCVDISNSADKPSLTHVHCGANYTDAACISVTTQPANGFREWIGNTLMIQQNVAASGACINGSLWTRTDATGGIYLCINGTWSQITVP